jgi:glucose-6-phosphate isomerase
LAIGFDNFDELLSGANEMDDHFKTADFDQNMPVVLALLSIWYNNFFGRRALIPYTQYLQKLAPYLQQQWRVMVKVWVETGNLLTTDWNYYLGEPELMRNMLFPIHQGTKLIPLISLVL